MGGPAAIMRVAIVSLTLLLAVVALVQSDASSGSAEKSKLSCSGKCRPKCLGTEGVEKRLQSKENCTGNEVCCIKTQSGNPQITKKNRGKKIQKKQKKLKKNEKTKRKQKKKKKKKKKS